MRRRGSRSSLYQVDFVAALFGAFLLLWIAKPTGHSHETEWSLVMLEAQCVTGDHTALIPVTSMNRCSSKAWADMADTGWGVVSCNSLPLDATKLADAELVGLPAKDNTTVSDVAVFEAVVSSMTFKNSHTQHTGIVSFTSVGVAPHPQKKYGGNPVALGVGSDEEPDQVFIGTPASVLFATNCPAGSCTNAALALYRAKYNGIHPGFHITLHSESWAHPCLRTEYTVGVNPANHITLEPC